MGTLRRGSRETFPLRTMGRAPCCDKARVKRGIWSSEEDAILKSYIERHGTGGNWIALPKKAGLNRCGKSCRLRWLNYLRPDIKRGGFTAEEESVIFNLYNRIGRRCSWSLIAAQLPGRTDNEIKNYWNANLKKKRLVANTDFISPIIAPSPQTPSVVIKAEPSSSICLSPSLQDVSASSSSPSFDDGGGSDIFRVLDLGVSSDQFLSWGNLGEGSAASGTNYGSASGLDPWDDVGIYERKLQLERDLGCGDDHSL